MAAINRLIGAVQDELTDPQEPAKNSMASWRLGFVQAFTNNKLSEIRITH